MLKYSALTPWLKVLHVVFILSYIVLYVGYVPLVTRPFIEPLKLVGTQTDSSITYSGPLISLWWYPVLIVGVVGTMVLNKFLGLYIPKFEKDLSNCRYSWEG